MLCAQGAGHRHELDSRERAVSQSAQWRMATAVRLCATADAGPRSTCALRRGNDGDMCEQSLVKHPEPEPDRTEQSCALCTGLSSKQGVVRTWSGMFRRRSGARDDVCHCGRFPGVLQQLWMDVSVRCPHAGRYTDSASNTGVAAVAGETEKTKRYARSLVFETYGRLGGEDTKLLRDLVTTAAANGQCSPHAGGRWRTQLERMLMSALAES